jgi:putative sterol carrier protein
MPPTKRPARKPEPRSEIADIFHELPKRFHKGAVKTPRTFYFSLDEDEKWTVDLTRDKCVVVEGKPDEDADCFFKSSKKMFLDVWSGRHVPGATDFLLGRIKSNNPMLLKEFVAAFGKQV